MDTWKPLQPTSIHAPASSHPPTTSAYAPPPKATRPAPPARPHPPSLNNVNATKRRSLLPSWARSSAAAAAASSQYSQAPSLGANEDVAEDPQSLNRPIGPFPANVHLVIMQHLTLPDLLAYLLTCRRIAHTAIQPSLWETRAAAMSWIPVPGVSVLPFDSQTSIKDTSDSRPSRDIGTFHLSDIPAYRSIKSYTQALRPYRDSLASSPDAPEQSILFSGPAATGANWGPYEQSSLLCNLLRSFAPAPHGPALFDDRPPSALLDQEDDSTSFHSVLHKSASILSSQLLDLFRSADDRRSDALRAAKYGASGTDKAVSRALGDLRLFATAIWQLGREVSQHTSTSGSDEGRRSDSPASFQQSEPDVSIADAAQAIWFTNRGKLIASLSLADTQESHKNIVFSTTPTGAQSATLDFTPMDRFIASVLQRFREEGDLMASIFPPEQETLLRYARQTANEIIADYVVPLLDLAQSHSRHLYLRCCAAAFTQCLRLAEEAKQIAPSESLSPPSALSHDTSTQLADVTSDWHRRFHSIYGSSKFYTAVYQVWDSTLTAYLEDECVWVREEMQAVAENWQTELDNESSASRMDASFLTAQNPAAVKRSVLTGFRDVLLLPVTVVPRTAVHVGGAVFRTAGKGVSQLNPLRWQAGAASSDPSTVGAGEAEAARTASSKQGREDNRVHSEAKQGYMDFSSGAANSDHMLDSYDAEAMEDEGDEVESGIDGFVEDEWSEEVRAWKEVASKASEARDQRPSKPAAAPKQRTNKRLTELDRSRPPSSLSVRSISESSRPGTPSLAQSKGWTPHVALQKMQLLLSLDTTLQMIHLNRDSLKRLETFLIPSELNSRRVQSVVEQVATAFLASIADAHVNPGFRRAIEQIQTWKPGEHDVDEGASPAASDRSKQPLVEPLVHFFELVHVGDTIAQLVQVYFDQELSRHVDKTDFLNGVVREKKKFEATLDEAVAAGLNAGVDLLMGEVEHIITTHQDPRDFYPERPESMDLGSPTQACSRAVACLQAHCKMLTGCADRNVLEVFWQEIALRLHSILCKHLKRQIISLDGGFKVIADLNAYHAFIASLKQSTLMPYFEALKMLGNVFIIEDPKELAQLVRDSSVFRGTLTPDDVYEFLQARCDFKAIEKAIDKEMFGFKIAEDCIVM